MTTTTRDTRRTEARIARSAAHAAFSAATLDVREAARESAVAAAWAGLAASLPAAEEEQAALLRDIIGNPWRPLPSAASFVTPDALALARRAYEDRLLPSGNLKPEHLTALASALQEAGCTDAELLGHLLGNGVHDRGCYAVDAVLGRQ